MLETARVQATRRELPRGALMAGRGSQTAAATLRRQGRIRRPRVVWINETAEADQDD